MEIPSFEFCDSFFVVDELGMWKRKVKKIVTSIVGTSLSHHICWDVVIIMEAFTIMAEKTGAAWPLAA